MIKKDREFSHFTPNKKLFSPVSSPTNDLCSAAPGRTSIFHVLLVYVLPSLHPLPIHSGDWRMGGKEAQEDTMRRKKENANGCGEDR